MKKIFKSFIPPVFSSLYYRLPIHSLKNFYSKNKSKLNLDDDLKKMTEAFISSESYESSSNYWNYLNINNYSSFYKLGTNNALSKICHTYFTYVNVSDEMINQLMSNAKNIFLSEKVNLFKEQNNMSFSDSIKYNCLTLLLYLNLKKLNLLDKLKLLSDEGYLIFNSPFIEIDNLKISQDKINALFDYENINMFSPFSGKKTILEIGSGSGRTTEAILTFNNNIKYTICEIPPSMYISYRRLKKVFKKKKIGLLYNLKENELEDEINKYDISFIMPHQLDFLNNKIFDLTIAIDCFHEMDNKTITKYFFNIDRISKLFYFSVGKKRIVPFSGIFFRNKLDYFNNDYNVPKNWVKKYEKDIIFPSDYISAGYKI